MPTSNLALPGGFLHAGDFTLQRKFAKANAAQTKTTDIAPWPPANAATIAHLDRVLSPEFSVN